MPPFIIVQTAVASFLDRESDPDSDIHGFIGILDRVELEVCVTPCEDRSYFDCDCRNAFNVYNSGKDECSDIMCDLVGTFRGKWKGVVQKMTEATSYQEMVVIALPLLEKLKSKVCNCRDDLPVAIQGCLTGRSDLFYEITNEMKRVRWGLVRKIGGNIMDAVCNRECQLSDTLHLVKLGRVLDESSSGSGSCLDFTETYNTIVQYLRSSPGVPDNLVDKVWCTNPNRKCRKELEKKFNTCCYGNLVDVFSDKMRGNLVKIIASILDGIVYDQVDQNQDSMEYIRSIVDVILNAMDPQKSQCSRSARDCEEV